MSTRTFEPNELFIYVNGNADSGRFEIGKVKRKVVNRNAYYCWYHEGDTAACTPAECMHKLENSYVIKENSLGGSNVEEFELCKGFTIRSVL